MLPKKDGKWTWKREKGKRSVIADQSIDFIANVTYIGYLECFSLSANAGKEILFSLHILEAKTLEEAEVEAQKKITERLSEWEMLVKRIVRRILN